MTTYNSRITSIDERVQVMIDTANALPEAGSGSEDLNTDLTALESEVSELEANVAAMETALANKAAGGSDPVLQEKTVTPTSLSQMVTPDNGYDGLSKVTVSAIPNTYVEPAATKGATTYTPGTTAQTIASGTYLTGTQTIEGDSNLVSENIVSGKTIFGVSGNAQTGGGGTGGSIDTVTITIQPNSPFGVEGTLYYVDGTGTRQSIKDTTGTIEVMKNSLMLAIAGSNGIGLGLFNAIYSTYNGEILFQATDNGLIQM